MNAAVRAEVAEWVLAADRIAVLTGAGISTASGIPDFRSANGIYSTHAAENVFDIELFRHDPRPFYRFAAWFYPTVAAAQPNAAHTVLAAWERAGKHVAIATQNIDDLHQRAGSQHVFPVHGSWLTSTCLRCSKSWRTADVVFPALENAAEIANTVPGGLVPPERKFHSRTGSATKLLHLPGKPAGVTPHSATPDVPHCACGGILKPDITFFGESLPETAWAGAMDAMATADLVLVLGTSLAVYPAAALPDYRSRQARLVIVNRDPTPLDAAADAVLRGDLPAVMRQIDARVFQA